MCECAEDKCVCSITNAPIFSGSVQHYTESLYKSRVMCKEDDDNIQIEKSRIAAVKTKGIFIE